MNLQTHIERAAATPRPVAMQHGRHGDRIVLARLRTERRWLVRHRDKADLCLEHPACCERFA